MELKPINNQNKNHSSEITGNSSFLLKIKYHQNTSIQGTIQWLEKKKTVCFRSLMELIMLIREAASDDIELRSWDGNDGLIEEVLLTRKPTGSDSRGGNP